MDFAPHTPADLEYMLGRVGRSSLDDLYAHLPASLRLTEALGLPDGCSEDEVVRALTELADRNQARTICFAGGGAYDHYVPAVVDAIIPRGEFLTAYTPYQPEVSQGVLQALFEYQTMISELTGLPVSNASLYDGGSAVAEAASMACTATRRDSVVVSAGLDRPSQQVLQTYAKPLGRRVLTAGLDPEAGTTPVRGPTLDGSGAAVIISQPNALGVVEDLRAHAEAAHDAGAQLIVKLEPTAVGLLQTPGAQGADLVVGEGQPLGQGLHYGGPTFGFLACTSQHVRRLPGRVVGRTVDTRGTTGYVMTLRAREQDIRRERATSNICTNQTLNALAATVYLAWLGPEGLRELAEICVQRAHHAAQRLTEIEGVTLAVSGPFLKEFALRLSVADVRRVVDGLFESGYLVGPLVRDPTGEAQPLVTVAVTERRTADDVEGLADALAHAVKRAA